MFRKISILALAIVLPACITQAQNDPMLSVTISPLHLIFPVVEVTGEYALTPDFGLAGILGYGSLTVKSNLEKDVNIPILELGGQANYYVFGSFRHGMQVGAELLWMKVSIPENEGVSAEGNGIAVGPLIGYKWAARFGLTFMVQGGYEFLFAQAKAKNSQGEELESSGEDSVLLVNMNAGWSF